MEITPMDYGISLCAIVHQDAPFQVTKIGGRGGDVLRHACQFHHNCIDPMIQPTCP